MARTTEPLDSQWQGVVLVGCFREADCATSLAGRSSRQHACLDGFADCSLCLPVPLDSFRVSRLPTADMFKALGQGGPVSFGVLVSGIRRPGRPPDALPVFSGQFTRVGVEAGSTDVAVAVHLRRERGAGVSFDAACCAVISTSVGPRSTGRRAVRWRSPPIPDDAREGRATKGTGQRDSATLLGHLEPPIPGAVPRAVRAVPRLSCIQIVLDLDEEGRPCPSSHEPSSGSCSHGCPDVRRHGQPRRTSRNCRPASRSGSRA
jgi:hypothetical protein